MAVSPPLPDIPPATPPRKARPATPAGRLRPLRSRLCRVLSELAVSVCSDPRRRLDGGTSDTSEPEPRKWYRVHPRGDLSYYVRRDLGPERSASLPASLGEPPEQGEKYHKTTPIVVDRNLCMGAPKGFERDAFSNDCRVCFEHPAEVVLLPCRHGGLCMGCFKANLFRMPAHRGGCTCPFCRVKIRQAVRLYHKAGVACQYGYAIEGVFQP